MTFSPAPAPAGSLSRAAARLAAMPHVSLECVARDPRVTFSPCAGERTPGLLPTDARRVQSVVMICRAAYGVSVVTERGDYPRRPRHAKH
ncbi:hypothetical protein GCM10023147_21110 [Tsukamurella soli]|uniref:Uncharacterized protein n=1 Tax=Tsukamurella soli TaxID=644556 RepID=A0ABP8JJE6_9ACTN